jgi:glucose/arabinose dehydrogenase
MKKIPLIIYSILLLPFNPMAKENVFKHTKEKVIEGVIWGLDFISEDEVLLTQREGGLYKYHLKTKKLDKIKHTLDVYSEGQGGLLDVLIDSDSGRKKTIYLTYAKKLSNNRMTTALYKGELNGDTLSGVDIFVAKTASDKGEHFGSRVVKKGKALFMSIGERGKRHEAQKLSNHHGVIVRLNLDGSAHKENPFKDSPYIFTYGHRNPQGLAVHQDSQELYEAEFGPRGGDELNIIKKGKNYGWPVITYGSEYWGPKIGETAKEGMEQPLKYWTPSISPSGLAIYSGKLFKAWKGNFFLANLSSQHLRRLVIKDNKVVEEEELLKGMQERMRVVKEAPNGEILIGTDSGLLITLKK